MTVRRGDGIGIDVTDRYVRAVRLAHDTPGRAAATVELPRSAPGQRADDESAHAPSHVGLVELFVDLVARLGDVDGVPTRISWFPPGSTLQSAAVQGWVDDDIDGHRRRFGEQGIHATLVTGAEDSRRLLGFRWDVEEAASLVELARVAGFHDPKAEPAPLALARVAPTVLCAAEVVVGRRRGWSMLMSDRTPLLAATNTPGSLTSEGPALVIAEIDPQAVRRQRDRLGSSSLSPERLAEVLGELTAAGTPLRSTWRIDDGGGADGTDAGDHAVALGAAIAAAGLVPAPLPRSLDDRRPGPAGADGRPWAVERLADPPPPSRPLPWWRRALRALRRWTNHTSR